MNLKKKKKRKRAGNERTSVRKTSGERKEENKSKTVVRQTNTNFPESFFIKLVHVLLMC